MQCIYYSIKGLESKQQQKKHSAGIQFPVVCSVIERSVRGWRVAADCLARNAARPGNINCNLHTLTIPRRRALHQTAVRRKQNSLSLCLDIKQMIVVTWLTQCTLSLTWTTVISLGYSYYRHGRGFLLMLTTPSLLNTRLFVPVLSVVWNKNT